MKDSNQILSHFLCLLFFRGALHLAFEKDVDSTGLFHMLNSKLAIKLIPIFCIGDAQKSFSHWSEEPQERNLSFEPG